MTKRHIVTVIINGECQQARNLVYGRAMRMVEIYTHMGYLVFMKDEV